MAVVLATLPFLALGLATGRLATVIVPPLVWIVFFAGLAAGWWGSGLGDGWIAAFVELTTAGAIAAGVGAILRRRIARTSRI
jgi:hypothetical protein